MLSVRIISEITSFFDAFSQVNLQVIGSSNSAQGGLFAVNCVISSEGIPIEPLDSLFYSN